MTIHTVFTRVVLRELPVMADIGINSHEIGRRQPLIVTVTLAVAPVTSDAIEATVDYRHIARLVEHLAERRIALIETFAHRIASQCVALPGVLSAEIAIDKPRALPAGIASVTMLLRRGDRQDEVVPAAHGHALREEV